MVSFVFIAPPAAGKGTQSKMLVEKYGYKHISTGDLLREEIEKSTKLGNEIKNIIAQGKLVNDEVMIKLLENNLNIKDSFIIDGFPRTINQAIMLDDLLIKKNVNNYKVINMNLSYDEALKRVLSRIVCSNCGKSYNLLVDELKPKVNNICDNCHQNLTMRNDDNEVTFKVRYDSYVNNTRDIIKYYEDKNKLVNISANEDANQIFAEIEKIVKGAN